ncbi:MAG: PA0069 family radical SAM protein [Cytophagaceae bacterium]
MKNQDPIKGRGAQIHLKNKFLSQTKVREHVEGIDSYEESHLTTYTVQQVKTILNKVESPDIGRSYSMNPYQGCEHGCIYCYARNSHEYWGYDAGLDFETKLIAKGNAAQLLKETFQKNKGPVLPIMLSGNTDCYQPLERKLGLTRQLLEVCLEHRHPVSVITKNQLVLRDIDLLQELQKLELVHVAISITSNDDNVRQKLEPRAAAIPQRFKTLETLAKNGISTFVMIAPIIPSINHHEIPVIMERAANAGAYSAGYTVVRLNGSIGEVFEDWLKKHYPDRAQKVWNQIKECHGGQVNDSRYGSRMRGEGEIADMINKLFKVSRRKYFGDVKLPQLRTDLFRPLTNGQMGLFE